MTVCESFLRKVLPAFASFALTLFHSGPAEAGIISVRGFDFTDSYGYYLTGGVRAAPVGGVIPFNDPGFWTIDGKITEVVAAVPGTYASVSAEGSVEHTTGPHIVDVNPNPNPFNFKLSVPLAGGGRVDRFPGIGWFPIRHPTIRGNPDHIDKEFAALKLLPAGTIYRLALRGNHDRPRVVSFSDSQFGNGGPVIAATGIQLPTIGGPGTSINLTQSTFSSFDFHESISDDSNGVVSELTLLDFSLGVSFFPTTDPEVFDASLSQFMMQFTPFNLQGVRTNPANITLRLCSKSTDAA